MTPPAPGEQQDSLLRRIAELEAENADLHRLLTTRDQPTQDAAQPLALAEATDARALETLQARLAAIIASSPDAMISFGLDDWHIQSWNRGAEMLFGWTEAEAVGSPVSLLVPDPPEGDPTSVYRWALEGRIVRDYETRRRTRSGDVIPVSITAARIASVEGRPFGVSAIFRDLRPSQAAEAARKESEMRLRAVLENVPVGVLLAEAPSGHIVTGRIVTGRIVTGRIVMSNRRTEEILRHPVLPPPKVDAYRAWESYHADGRRVEGHEYPLARALAGEESPSLLVHYRRGDDTLAWIRMSAAPVRDPATGAITGAAAAIADIDAERRAADALAASEARFRALSETLEERVRAEVGAREAAQARLARAEKLTALGELAGGVAHDFNNVLQSVGGGAGLIKARLGNPAAVERFAGLIEDAARRGTSITRRLLAFAQRDQLRAEPLAVALLLDSVREMLAHTLGPNIRIAIDVMPGLPPVLADRGQLETALINLATNARDAMPDGGRLSFTARVEAIGQAGSVQQDLSPGVYIRIDVADTGTGMDATTLARVMEPFFTTKPQGRGTGLGLPMVRGFTEQSGGTLTINSQPQLGTTVTLWLPSADAPGASRVVDALRQAVPAGAPRILLVDDELLVRQVVAAQLADRGFNVVQADGGATALAVLTANEPLDLVISDLSMPGMDGAALIQEAQRLRSGLPAILLTGYAGIVAERTSNESAAGAFSVLRKPVSSDQLVDRIERVLGAAAAAG